LVKLFFLPLVECAKIIYKLRLLFFTMSVTKKELTLSSQAFWDFDTNKIDFEKNADYTVIRVLERGNKDDYKQIVDFFGKPRVKAIVSRSQLSPRARVVAKRILSDRRPLLAIAGY
jgi:hypothetical protein